MKWIIIALLTCAFSAGLVYLFGAWINFDWGWPQHSADSRMRALFAFGSTWFMSMIAAFAWQDLK